MKLIFLYYVIFDYLIIFFSSPCVFLSSLFFSYLIIMSNLEEKYLFLAMPNLKVSTKEDFQTYQKKFIELTQLVNSSDLISNNESINEISINSLKFITCDYLYAKFIDSNGMVMFDSKTSSSEVRNKFRLIILKIVEDLLNKFLIKVLNIEIFNDFNGDILPNFKHLNKWIEKYIEVKQNVRSNDGPNGFIKLDELEREIYASSGPVGRRDAKIEKWQLEKMLREDVKNLDQISVQAQDEDDIEDEDEIRSLWIKKIQLTVIESISLLESIIMEREMLEKIVKHLNLDDSLKIEGLTIIDDKDDGRIKDNKFDKGYTDKIEVLDSDKPLMSKEGKVLRPFTIVSSNEKRKDFKSKVFGTGQVLPTMTVEELVDYEMANGGMVKPEEPEPEIDEDDIQYQDKETYRLREWDEFTDTHKKGSGNTMGNIG